MKVALLLLLLLAITTAARAETDSADSWNVRTNPVGWVVGPNIRLEYKFAEQWTIAPRFNYVEREISSVKMTGATLGLSLTYSLTAAFQDSFYLEVGATSGELKAEVAGTSLNVSNFSSQILGGYHWFWNDFNLILGAGIVTNSEGGVAIRDLHGNKIDTVPLSRAALLVDTSIGFIF